MNDRQEGRERWIDGAGRLLWWMGGCGGCWPASLSFSEVVYRSALLIGFEVACSVVAVSKHVSLF